MKFDVCDGDFLFRIDRKVEIILILKLGFEKTDVLTGFELGFKKKVFLFEDFADVFIPPLFM